MFVGASSHNTFIPFTPLNSAMIFTPCFHPLVLFGGAVKHGVHFFPDLELLREASGLACKNSAHFDCPKSPSGGLPIEKRTTGVARFLYWFLKGDTLAAVKLEW